MGLADAIRAATAVIPNKILPGLAKSRVEVRRKDTGYNADATPVQTYTPTGLTIAIYIEQITGGRSLRMWGSETTATAESMVAIGTDIRELDALAVLSGDFAGRTFFVAKSNTNYNGGIMILALNESERPT